MAVDLSVRVFTLWVARGVDILRRGSAWCTGTLRSADALRCWCSRSEGVTVHADLDSERLATPGFAAAANPPHPESLHPSARAYPVATHTPSQNTPCKRRAHPWSLEGCPGPPRQLVSWHPHQSTPHTSPQTLQAWCPPLASGRRRGAAPPAGSPGPARCCTARGSGGAPQARCLLPRSRASQVSACIVCVACCGRCK